MNKPVQRRLPYPDLWHLQAAEGWLLLRNSPEATRELDQIRSCFGRHPDVLAMRCRIFIQARNWRAALNAATEFVRVAPGRAEAWINRAYCLHELRRTAEAIRRLSPAARWFPREHVVALNLAWYCLELEHIGEATRWMRRAAFILHTAPGTGI